MNSPSIALFALNGIGSVTLKVLADLGCNIVGLWTRHEPNKHPYFETQDINVLARCKSIRIFYDHEPFHPEQKVDLLLSCTYHRKILAAHRDKARLAINIHQSLLPAHAGRDPFKSQIAEQEVLGGVTAHHINDEWDDGEIISQYECNIAGLNENKLRERLGVLSAAMAVNVVSLATQLTNNDA
jgi:methionyl-tRNA formyltransferase